MEDKKPQWNIAEKDGTINVPDYLDNLLNKVGMQIRMHKISRKNEVQTICDIVYLSEKFFTELIQKERDKAIVEFQEKLKVELSAVQNIMYRSVNGVAQDYLLEATDHGCNEVIEYLIEKTK